MSAAGDRCREALGTERTWPWESVPAGVPCWWIHHGKMLEWSYEDLDTRALYILESKPRSEWETRMDAMRPVVGKLPEEVVEACRAHNEAGRAHNEAGRAYDEACRAYNEAYRAYNEAYRAYDEAGRAHDEAGRAHNEAGRAYDEARRSHLTEIAALCKKECHDVKWNDNGLIFPKEDTP
jgi:hypothetical protein